MPAVIAALPGNEVGAEVLAGHLNARVIQIAHRRFPDGECYLRFDDELQGRDVVLLCTLADPDPKVLPLLFAAALARELGASRVGLVAPYLAYMRQDMRFRPGEAVTSRYFAALLSRAFDWLVTVDPHLHRYASLDKIYAVPAEVVHAAPLLSRWITREIEHPLLIGPDAESEQWVAAVAAQVGAPYTVLSKTRRGDRDVEVSVPTLSAHEGRTPVLLDDIVSTASTMIKTSHHLRNHGAIGPICLAVHGLFADNAYNELKSAGADRIVTTNTVQHPSNGIDVFPLLSRAIRRRLDQ